MVVLGICFQGCAFVMEVVILCGIGNLLHGTCVEEDGALHTMWKYLVEMR